MVLAPTGVAARVGMDTYEGFGLDMDMGKGVDTKASAEGAEATAVEAVIGMDKAKRASGVDADEELKSQQRSERIAMNRAGRRLVALLCDALAYLVAHVPNLATDVLTGFNGTSAVALGRLAIAELRALCSMHSTHAAADGDAQSKRDHATDGGTNRTEHRVDLRGLVPTDITSRWIECKMRRHTLNCCHGGSTFETI